MSFLVIDGLSKSYGDVHALVDLNLQVAKGEFIGLLGPSGCGKTTTLQALAGFVQPTRGRIVLDGRDITRLDANQRGLGIVFQSYALFPHMTVAQNVAFGLEMRGLSRSDCSTRVGRMLDLVHLQDLAQRYPRELSGGQRQRVAVARALVIEPPMLLLDEPLSNLDAKLREAMQFELRRIQRKLGTTTIMVTHDQAEALSISDRVVVMHAGRVQQIDAPHKLYEHPRAASSRASSARPTCCARWCAAANWTCPGACGCRWWRRPASMSPKDRTSPSACGRRSCPSRPTPVAGCRRASKSVSSSAASGCTA
jgi:putative spermidine/putrescine transport system ATP-binding protein